MRRGVLAAVLVGVLSGCTSGGPEQAAPVPSPSPSSDAATPGPLDEQGPVDGLPALADPPAGDVTLWLDTIGVPVVAAVRTSTQLAQLADVPDDQRAAVCRQVAADLDAIAAPQVLTGLAITVDAETATLLVGDLQAKGDLLAACIDGGPELDDHIDEVARTHAVAVAWIARLRGDG